MKERCGLPTGFGSLCAAKQYRHKLARVDSESGQHGATWLIAHVRKQWLPDLSPSLFSGLGASLLLTVQYNALVMHCVIKGKKKAKFSYELGNAVYLFTTHSKPVLVLTSHD